MPANDSTSASLKERLLSATTLFVITIYAPFAVASLLSQISGGDLTADFACVTLLCMAFGTCLSAILTGTTLVVAPAIGFAALFANTNDSHILTLPQMLLASLLAGLICLALCWKGSATKSFRFRLLESIPPELRLGVKAGVGVLLASEAIESLRATNATYDGLKIVFFLFGLVLLLFVDSFAQRYKKFTWTGIAQIFVTVVLGGFYYSQTPAYDLQSGLPFWEFLVTLKDFRPCTANLPVGFTLLAIFCFAAIIVFIIVTDIPGTPFEIFREKRYKGENHDPAIERSFITDSMMAMLNPFLNIGPSIYYSENFVVTHVDKDIINVRVPAFLCAFGYLAVAFMVFELPLPIAGFKDWSLASVAPVLFFVGLKISASSMLSDYERAIEGDADNARRVDFTFYYYMPVATTALITHFAGLAVGLPAGVIVYVLYAWAKPIEGYIEWYVKVLACCSAVILVLLAIFALSHGASISDDKSHKQVVLDHRGCNVER